MSNEYRISQEQLLKMMHELCPSDHPDRNGRTWDTDAVNRAVNEWLKNNKETKLITQDEEESKMLNKIESEEVTSRISDLNITLEEYNKCRKLLGESDDDNNKEYITCAMNNVFTDVHTRAYFEGLTYDTRNKLIDAMIEVLEEVCEDDAKKLKRYLYTGGDRNE